MGGGGKHHLMQSKSDSNVNQNLVWSKRPFDFCEPQHLCHWLSDMCSAAVGKIRGIYAIHHLVHIIMESFFSSCVDECVQYLWGLNIRPWLRMWAIRWSLACRSCHMRELFRANVGNEDWSLYWIWIKKSIWVEELSSATTLSLTCTLTPLAVSSPVLSCD